MLQLSYRHCEHAAEPAGSPSQSAHSALLTLNLMIRALGAVVPAALLLMVAGRLLELRGPRRP